MTCIPLFKQPVNGSLSYQECHFNYQLSQVHVCSEHTIGLLKTWVQSLKELRIQINSKEWLDFTVIWIRCCIILHNLIIDIEGNPIQGLSTDWQREMAGMMTEESVRPDNSGSSITVVHPRDFRDVLVHELFSSSLYH